MKKLLTAFIFILVLSSANAQDEKNVIKINPIGILLGSANIGYERAISQKSSILIAPTYGYFNSSGDKFTIYGISGEYRFYVSGTKYAPRGWYVGPGLEFAGGSVKTADNSEKIDAKGFAIKAIGGHQWIFRGGFALDINAGVQYLSINVAENNQGVGSYSGVLPTISIAVGYAF
ncbi:MAG: hypothetical protein C5B52_17620 [Bacteroidetes bacterium]|nr:MAG: hypothetical protein C5B52_17620 [Bacteroidota bacterium]